MAKEVVVATGIGGDLCVRVKGFLDQASGTELWGRAGLRVAGGGGGAASTRRLRAPVAAARWEPAGKVSGRVSREAGLVQSGAGRGAGWSATAGFGV